MSALLWLLGVVAVATAASGHLRRPQWLKQTRPEMWMDSVQLAEWQGYKMDTHSFVSSDGYVTVLHRIPSSQNGTRGDIPVLIGHGLCSSDEQWLVRGPNALIFLLAERGFDIWLANYRGSFYSQRHKTLTVKDQDFWNFSFHENGVIDQAESIDYVLKTTGKKDLIAIGHSMSSTAQAVLLAERPEYNEKVRGMVLLAPPVFFKHATNFLAYSGRMISTVPGMKRAGAEYVENDLFPGLDKPFPQSCFVNYGGFNPKIMQFCKRILNFAMGNLHEPIDIYRLQLIMHHYPAGSSIRQVLHYAQCIVSGNFAQYNYGKDRNLEMYGQDTPPLYNVTNIMKPLYLVYSKGDGTVNWRDVEEFARAVRPGVLKALHKVSAPDYCHIDYLIAHDAEELVYPHIIKYVEEIGKS